MINVKNITMNFEKITALKDVSLTIPKGCIYGIVGSNGAGKSTLLRTISGIYKPTKGEVFVEEQKTFDNPKIKKKISFVSDDLYFLPDSRLRDMADLFYAAYDSFSFERFYSLAKTFDISTEVKINTLSKGIKRACAIILSLSTMSEYYLFDETLDGLDAIMRNVVKQIIFDEVMEKNATVILTSHSLRELEDTCDQLALLHKGGIIVENDTQSLQIDAFKIQIAFSHNFTKNTFSKIEGFEILNYSQSGSVATFIAKGEKSNIHSKLKTLSPAFLDILPLNLEEVFVYKMESLGYNKNALK